MALKPKRGGFRLEGTRDLERVLKKLPNQVRGRVMRNAVMAGAREVVKVARQTVPVGETGLLRRSIMARSEKAPIGRGKVEVRVGPSRRAFYGLFQEFGSVHQPARPWLRPAWEAAKGSALKKMGAGIGRAIERAAKKLAGPLMRSGLVRRGGGRRR